MKVLLADDSAAIKKVVQLSLQDLGLELKSISSGKDALDLAKQFKPDIAFIDVMLPQRTGYDIASDIRKDPNLKNTPIVLLWSAFMAFDEARYTASGANAKLEKPFDAKALRSLVSKLVPKSLANPLSQHVDLPNIDFEVPIGTVPQAKTVPLAKTAPQAKTDWSTTDFQDLNSFSAGIENSGTVITKTHSMPLPEFGASQPSPNLVSPDLVNPNTSKPAKLDLATPDPASWNNDNEWVKKDLGKFSVPIPDDENNDIPFEYSENKIVDTSFLFRPSEAGTTKMFQETVKANEEVPSTTGSSSLSPSSLSIEELSDIKLEAREIIEKIAWKLVPELASQIIREELDRLLSPEMSEEAQKSECSVNLEALITLALKEDIPKGDMTTDPLECDSKIGEAKVIAKQDLVLSGTVPFEATFKKIDEKIKIQWKKRDGDHLSKNTEVGKITGPLSSLLKGERTALNFLGHLSGVATITFNFVKETQGTTTKIIDTRKTTPGLRELEKQAVLHGGGGNHRMSLSDGILIKENHIRAAGSITTAVKKIREKWPKTSVEVEVTSKTEIDEALKCRVERLLLDNMSNEEIALAVKQVANHAIIEASGNMTLDRIKSVARLGVNFISIGSITHSAPSADLSLLFERGIL